MIQNQPGQIAHETLTGKYLPSKCEILSSSLSIAKKKKKRERKRRRRKKEQG
jgi:hypothetical protein